jgi:hypothetical protein
MAGLILQPHPAPWEYWVNFIGEVSIYMIVFFEEGKDLLVEVVAAVVLAAVVFVVPAWRACAASKICRALWTGSASFTGTGKIRLGLRLFNPVR